MMTQSRLHLHSLCWQLVQCCYVLLQLLQLSWPQVWLHLLTQSMQLLVQLLNTLLHKSVAVAQLQALVHSVAVQHLQLSLPMRKSS